MNRSTKFNFYLPQVTDLIDPADYNYNFEIIDDNLITESQTFTDTQKTTARTNIGAAKASDLGSPSSASAVTGDDAFSKINALNGKIPTFTVVEETKTTGSTGNIATGYSGTNKIFVTGAQAVGSDAYLRTWRASSNGVWYITAVNPNTGATINNTQLELRYLVITMP